ncbi:hypothetical protein Tco_0246162 [Tanacetum coccineum]
MRSFQTNKSVNKTNASDGLFKPVTQQNLPQNRNQAVRNTNVLKPGMYRIASTTTQTRTPQLPHASRNTNPHMSKSSGVIHTTSVSRPQLLKISGLLFPFGKDIVASNSWLWRILYSRKFIDQNGFYYSKASSSQSFPRLVNFVMADLELLSGKSTCFVRDLQGKRFTNSSPTQARGYGIEGFLILTSITSPYSQRKRM